MIEFQMPSLGADMEAGILREWFKKPGDTIKRGDIIADVETQKGIIEIEVFDDGVIEKLLIKEGDKVPVGTVMALINSTTKKETRKPEVVSEKLEAGIHRARISPLAKKMAEENHLDLSKIKGNGDNGAITSEDIKLILRSSPKKETGAENIRMAIAAAMSKSNAEIPHYYLETRVDMRNALTWLEEKNKSLTIADRILPTVLFIKAVAFALRQFPELNAVWKNQLILRERINIGIVITLRDGGIVIPALPEPDKKTLAEIMHDLTDLIQRARSMKLRSSDLSESTITLTNLGDNAVETVFGVIYPPQVALIGTGSIQEEPWAENGMLDVRPIAHLTLSADHRATDGHTGGRFLNMVKHLLENPEKL